MERRIGGYTREAPVRPWSLIEQHLRWWSALSPSPVVHRLRDALSERFSQSDLTRQSGLLGAHFRAALARGPDVVMISTYLMYRDIVEQLYAVCRQSGIPTIVGGPYFTEPRVRESWRRIDGLTALAVGENEYAAADLVEALASAVRWRPFPPSQRHAPGPTSTASLRALDELPYPDYSDSPGSVTHAYRLGHRRAAAVVGARAGSARTSRPRLAERSGRDRPRPWSRKSITSAGATMQGMSCSRISSSTRITGPGGE